MGIKVETGERNIYEAFINERSEHDGRKAWLLHSVKRFQAVVGG
jgi:hypothetical protein